MRPRVGIADEISVRKTRGKEYYTFKVINRSFFSGFDMKIEANFCKRTTANKKGKHKHVTRDKLELTTPTWVHIPAWKWVDENTEEAPHCITVRCLREDLKKLISENQDYIEFQVTLKHGFSNLTKTFIKQYHGEFCFKNGKFDFGNTFEIQ